jgi:hypothetical protein
VDSEGALPMPDLVRQQAFADGPPRWYARRGPLVLSGDSRVEVLAQIWEQDEAILRLFMAKVDVASPGGSTARP